MDLILVDIGSHSLKAGYSEEDVPSVIVPSLVGHSDARPVLNTVQQSKYYIGDEVEPLAAILDIENPVKRGEVQNFEFQDKLFYYMFYQCLRTDPSERALFFTEPLNNDEFNRRKIAQEMFEIFSVPGVIFANSSLMSLYGVDPLVLLESKSGVLLECGYGVTQTCLVKNGAWMKQACKRVDLGSQDILTRFVEQEKRVDFSASKADLLVAEQAVQSLALLFSNSNEKSSKSFQLPDGTSLTLSSSERMKITEVLFNGNDSVTSLLFDCIGKDKSLLNNVCLTGGTSLMEGYIERFKTELVKHYSNSSVTIKSPEFRKYASWIGSKFFSSILSEEEVVTKKMFEEVGESALFGKPFQ